jgi:hypothetical protein
MMNFFIPLAGIIKAQLGSQCTHEMNTLLTWKCHVGATMVGHMAMMGHDGDVNFVASMIFPGYRQFYLVQWAMQKIVLLKTTE